MSKKMPALFVGHGSPMNAVEQNAYTKMWEQLGQQLPRPKEILMISAHWYTQGPRITDAAVPQMVYDMYGFPEELYRIRYDCPGFPQLARRVKGMLSAPVRVDNTWGLDHGAWSVLCRMFPQADIPVVQLSIDGTAGADAHYKMGQELAALREDGVMIMGSGNVVHNLARISWETESGFPWAEEFDGYVKKSIEQCQFENVVDYKNAGSSAKMAFPTPDHFFPLLYVLGAADQQDDLTVFNEDCLMGSLSMTSYLFQSKD